MSHPSIGHIGAPSVHYAFTSPQYQSAVINAFNIWNYVANFRFLPNNNQQWNFIFDDARGFNYPLGMTYVDNAPYNSINSVTTVLNSSWGLVDVNQDPIGFDVQTLALHEFGHWLDLYHSADSDAVMVSGQAVGASRRVLRLDDRNGIREIYPNWYVNLTGNMAFTGTADSFTRWYGTQLGDKGLTGDFNGTTGDDIAILRFWEN